LNHVALVEEGRAGPEARLLNHRASIAHNQKDVSLMKVTINGVELEVPDVAVTHYSAQISNLEGQVQTLNDSATALTNSVGEITAERDSAVGALTAAQAELTNAKAQVTELENSAPDIAAEATRIANEHSAFAAEAGRLGYKDELGLGQYEPKAVMLTVLNARGAKFDETANEDTLKGAWSFALSNTDASTRSVIDNALPNFSMDSTSASSAADTAVNNSYFGGAKKKEA
jgi:hypothetical protein